MKSLYTLIIAILLLSSSAQAQDNLVAIYEQDFSTTVSGIQTSTWQWGTFQYDNPDDNPSQSSGKFIKTNNSAAIGSALRTFTLPAVSTFDMVGLTITWREYRTQYWRHKSSGDVRKNEHNQNHSKIDNTNPVRLEYSFDGVNFSSEGIEFSQNTSSFFTWGAINNGKPVFLPEQVLNREKVFFRWSIVVNSANTDYYAIDDIRISGETDQQIGALPVELAWFKGAMQGNTAQLTWSTASEVNNEKFIVERSQDGRSFSKIGEVAGRGNSIVTVAYAFTDTNPASGTNYYRLRQVDFDGAEEFSKIVAVQFKGKYGLSGGMAKVYPTLAASEVNVSLDLSSAQVAVLDASGRQLSQHSVAGQSLVLPVTHLQPGLYFVKVYNGQQQETHRFVKQ